MPGYSHLQLAAAVSCSGFLTPVYSHTEAADATHQLTVTVGCLPDLPCRKACLPPSRRCWTPASACG